MIRASRAGRFFVKKKHERKKNFFFVPANKGEYGSSLRERMHLWSGWRSREACATSPQPRSERKTFIGLEFEKQMKKFNDVELRSKHCSVAIGRYRAHWRDGRRV